MRKNDRPFQENDVVASYIHAVDGSERILRRIMLVSKVNDKDTMTALNITSDKPNKDYGRIYGNTFVTAEQSGLSKNSYVVASSEYLIPQKTAKLLENITMPEPVIKRLKDVKKMILKEGGDIPLIDSTDIKKRDYEFQEEQDMILDVCKNFKGHPKLLADYLKFSARFYRYSARNQFMIYSKNPFSTFVASYTQWKKMGYSVKKLSPNDPRLFIVCPSHWEYFLRDSQPVSVRSATQEEKEKIANGEIEVHTKDSFKRALVYDISQTNCPPKDYPRFFDPGYQSLDHLQLYQCIKRCAESSGFSVEETNLHSISLDGVCIPSERKILISDRLEDSEKLAALCHEYAHGLIHFTTDQPKQVEEFEAEALSGIICDRFGLPISERDQNYLSQYYDRISDLEGCAVSDSFERIKKAYNHVDRVIQDYIKETPALLERYQARFQGQLQEAPAQAKPENNRHWKNRKQGE